MMQPNAHFITGFKQRMASEPFTIKQAESRISAFSSSLMKGDDIRTKQRLFDISWLKASAPLYHISDNPNDYVFANVRAFAMEIPNRNGHMFCMDEVTKFSVDGGKLSYQTFEGKPLLLNHKYHLPSALGIIVASRLVQDGPYGAVELIVGCDKTKNRIAAEAIKNGEACFSMGANAERFSCTVCGAEFALSKPCTHCDGANVLLPYGEKERELSCMKVHNPFFIEHSFLHNEAPADPRALHGDMQIT